MKDGAWARLSARSKIARMASFGPLACRGCRVDSFATCMRHGRISCQGKVFFRLEVVVERHPCDIGFTDDFVDANSRETLSPGTGGRLST